MFDMFKSKIARIEGWYGLIFILFAYFLLNFDFVSKMNLIYQMLNLFGALGVAISALVSKSKPAAVLNLIWALIATISLVGMIK